MELLLLSFSQLFVGCVIVGAFLLALYVFVNVVIASFRKSHRVIAQAQDDDFFDKVTEFHNDFPGK